MRNPSPLSSHDAGAVTSSEACHVAIIMDGNGRWAKARGLPRAVGHERGVEALRRVVECAGQFGITHMTLFSFSTENWRRPADEVSALFGLLKTFVKRDMNRLHKEGVCIKVAGRREGLPADILKLIESAETLTRDNTKFHLCIAFNYGGREEIVRAVQDIASKVEAGEMSPKDITETSISEHMDTFGYPDPDLLIRTSGECRISNFLLWQLAYSEMIFMDVFWPDFDASHLGAAMEQFRLRERRFGDVTSGGA